MAKKYLITGGAGFIGANYVNRLLARGETVTVFDNLSRPGVAANLDWLRAGYGADSFRFLAGDVRDFQSLRKVMQGQDVVVHLAGQTAVTVSVDDPRKDFETNGMGTFNTLEAARQTEPCPIFVYASTNKVYGSLNRERIIEKETRYAFHNLREGITELQPLDFHSPYACSKGLGDQYVLDYHRTYGMPTVVLRQSAICGPRQMGMEDQGWLAWFMIAAVKERPIKIFGDGKQVRDILHIDDLLDVYDAVIENIGVTAGRVYNIGGGPGQTLSVWREFGPMLEGLVNHSLPVTFAPFRPSDQLIYCSNIARAKSDFGWLPKIPVSEIVERLYRWVTANQSMFG